MSLDQNSRLRYLVCDEHWICDTLICHLLDDDEIVPEKANVSVAVSDDVDPTST
jgi:hypothetical protein